MSLNTKLRSAAWMVRSVKNWPALFMNRAGFGQPCVARVRGGPTILIGSRTSVGVLCEAYGRNAYHLPADLPADAIVVDIGANVGFFALYASRQLASSGRVIAIEPSPVCLGILRQNLSINGVRNVEVVEAALGTNEGRAALTVDAEALVGSSLYCRASEPKDRISVRIMSPKALLSLAPTIDFLKADCEGGEHALVWESEPADWQTVKAVAMEYHSGFGTGYPSDENPSLLAERLRQFGFLVSHEATVDGRGYLYGHRSAPGRR